MMNSEIEKNRRYVVQYLREYGFKVIDTTGKNTEYPDEKYSYYLGGELVGWSYDNVLYMHKSMPSLVEMGVIGSESKSTVKFDVSLEVLKPRLFNAVDRIKRSYNNYDKIVKEYRAEQVRRYFKKKESSAFAKLLHDADRRSV